MTTDLLRRSEPREKLKRSSLRREKLLPPQSTEKGPVTKRRLPDLYAQLPLGIFQHPPVRDARTANEMHLLTKFEFGVLVGVQRVAARAYDQLRLERALAVGSKMMARERLEGRHHLARWKRQQEQGRGKPNLGRSIKRVGEDTYRRVKKKQRPPDVIAVECSRYDILRSVGLNQKALNLDRVPEALERLRQCVGPMDSPLLGWTNENRQLQLEVRGQWLEPPFGRVPLPLPLRSSVATCLYLWALSIAGTRTPRAYQKIRLERLCELIGISTSLGRAYARRALLSAIDVLNEQLGKLRRDELVSLSKPIVLPVRYEIKSLKDDYIQLVAVKQEDEDCP